MNEFYERWKCQVCERRDRARQSLVVCRVSPIVLSIIVPATGRTPISAIIVRHTAPAGYRRFLKKIQIFVSTSPPWPPTTRWIIGAGRKAKRQKNWMRVWAGYGAVNFKSTLSRIRWKLLTLDRASRRKTLREFLLMASVVLFCKCQTYADMPEWRFAEGTLRSSRCYWGYIADKAYKIYCQYLAMTFLCPILFKTLISGLED